MNDYPDHLTQGHGLADLEVMLTDVYQIRQEEEKRLNQKRKSGQILLPKFSAITILMNWLQKQ